MSTFADDLAHARQCLTNLRAPLGSIDYYTASEGERGAYRAAMELRESSRRDLVSLRDRRVVSNAHLGISELELGGYLSRREFDDARKKTVDADPDWRRRNDLAPDIFVHMAMESALTDARRTLTTYPVIGGSGHPLGISFYQSRAAAEEKYPIPNSRIFCSTTELRDRVLSALVSEALKQRCSAR